MTQLDASNASIPARSVSDYSKLAELAQVSRARITQIMNLLLLAPDFQESLLFMEPVRAGRDTLTLMDIQKVALEINWGRQSENWLNLSRPLGPTVARRNCHCDS